MNFVEHVAIASREVVFSAAIAWLLGESSPLSVGQRLAIINIAFGLDFQGGNVARIVAEREWKKIDILLTLENEAGDGDKRIAIENKINAAEHGTQLQRYDRILAGSCSNEVIKIYLTVLGEAPQGGAGWQARSYGSLRAGLDAVVPGLDMAVNPRLVYIRDIRDAVDRISNLAQNATCPVLAGVAFRDIKKLDTVPEAVREQALYLRAARLEELMQRLWMTSLAEHLTIPRGWKRTPVEETRGNALFNIQRPISVGRIQLMIGIQLQGRRLKLFCSPEPYGNPATDDQLAAVNGVLADFPGAFPELQGIEVRPAAGLGFRSISWCAMPKGRKIEDWRNPIQERIGMLVRHFP